MRRRLNTYTINSSTNSIVLGESVTLEDIRLIVDETQHKIVCSSMQKNNMVVTVDGVKTTIAAPVTISADNKTITIDTRVCALNTSDAITIEIDNGDKLSEVISNISTLSDKVLWEHATTRTVISTSESAITSAVSTAESNVKTAISDAQSALIGTNTEASQTKILEAVQQAILDAAEMNKTAYASVFQKNEDGADTYTMILPNIFEVDETTQTVTV